MKSCGKFFSDWIMKPLVLYMLDLNVIECIIFYIVKEVNKSKLLPTSVNCISVTLLLPLYSRQ